MCLGAVVDGAAACVKLLVHSGLTVAGLQKIMSDKVPGVAIERRRLADELQQDGDALLRDLDRRLRAADDLLYARFDGT